jgi:hypothetical protein
MQDIESCLIGLHSIVGSGTRYAEKAESLLDWYKQNGDLTKKQIAFAINIIRSARNGNNNPRCKQHYLYAISDGRNVKIGFSTNPKTRRRELQTGCAAQLQIIWKMSVGESRMIAAKKERKLHRYSRRYHLHGEWFKKYCMLLVGQFEAKELAMVEVEKESEERQILISAMALI